MARLADDPQYLDFAMSVRNWEGCKLHFYGDSKGLVTLGIGHLFDEGHPHPGMNLNYGRRYALDASRLYPFTAGAAAVYEDWCRVKRLALTFAPNYQAHTGREYSGTAQLRITLEAAINGLKAKVRTLSAPIYEAHPTLENFDVRVAMAIIDVRFNARRLGVLSQRFEPIWTAIEAARTAAPGSPERTQAAQDAYNHFRLVYREPAAHEDGVRFFRRHHQRVQRLREGLEATFGVVINVTPADESWHY